MQINVIFKVFSIVYSMWAQQQQSHAITRVGGLVVLRTTNTLEALTISYGPLRSARPAKLPSAAVVSIIDPEIPTPAIAKL